MLRLVQSELSAGFIWIMLLMETLKEKAILPQLSFSLTIYTMGVGVSVGGRGVLVSVAVPVSVTVGVMVAVRVGGTLFVAEEAVGRVKRNTPPPPAPKIMISKPIITGRLRVTVGMRGPVTDWSDLPFDLAEGVRDRPQTWQRVALSLTRVPQVGQTFVDEDIFS